MAVLMSELCSQGADLIWKQCNEELFAQGLEYLERAAEDGDADALFFLGHCYSWGDAAVGFNDKKAYECYLAGAEAGSARCVLGALRAGQYDERLQAQARYSLAESLQIVMEAAAGGEPYAAYQLADGFYYDDFYDILPKSERAAGNCFKWYEKAGEGGIVNAMERAGKCCFSGTYTRKDVSAGLYWAEKAAAAGSAWGLLKMGLFTLEQQDYEAAFAYLYAAARQGDEEAPFYLGEMCLNGAGTEQDTEQAIAFFEEAARHDNRESFVRLGQIYSEGEYENYERACYWYSRAYSAGDHQVGLALGRLYCMPGEYQDFQKAERLLAEYAQGEEDGQACCLLAHLYHEGLIPGSGAEKAAAYFEQGASMGNDECIQILGHLYFEGEELPQNYARAYELLNSSWEKGTLRELCQLAYLCRNGYGCEKDEKRAAELYRKAAETEKNADAYYELGSLYEKGTQIQRDLEQAVDYYRQAALLGNDSARRRLTHFKRNIFGKWKYVN